MRRTTGRASGRPERPCARRRGPAPDRASSRRRDRRAAHAPPARFSPSRARCHASGKRRRASGASESGVSRRAVFRLSPPARRRRRRYRLGVAVFDRPEFLQKLGDVVIQRVQRQVRLERELQPRAGFEKLFRVRRRARPPPRTPCKARTRSRRIRTPRRRAPARAPVSVRLQPRGEGVTEMAERERGRRVFFQIRFRQRDEALADKRAHARKILPQRIKRPVPVHPVVSLHALQRIAESVALHERAESSFAGRPSSRVDPPGRPSSPDA